MNWGRAGATSFDKLFTIWGTTLKSTLLPGRTLSLDSLPIPHFFQKVKNYFIEMEFFFEKDVILCLRWGRGGGTPLDLDLKIYGGEEEVVV